MRELRAMIEGDKEHWDLFTKRSEYFIERPDRYQEHDLKNKDINVLQPKISKFLIENGLKIEYPGSKRFAVCLTHDIDMIYPPLSHTFLSSLYCVNNIDLRELKRQLFWRCKGREHSPYWNFREIMNLEEKFGAKSSFYFLATGKDIKKFRYHIEDLKNELRYIAEKGWEIGLHGGCYTYNDLEQIKMERDRLEKVLGKEVIGYRNHYLRFKIPDTWVLLAEAGFKYDTTFGYNDMVGFRNGMCHPFRPFNLNSNKEIPILEIALNIMDGALFKVYSFQEAWEVVKKLVETVENYSGVLTILWHNYFNCPFRNNWVELYKKILEYCRERDAWMTSGEEIWRWWEGGC